MTFPLISIKKGSNSAILMYVDFLFFSFLFLFLFLFLVVIVLFPNPFFTLNYFFHTL